MTDLPVRPPVDYARLASYLKVLGVPARVELLRKLQIPRSVAEIDVRPSRDHREMSGDRAISRQALEVHLRKLQGMGLVSARASKRDGRAVTEFVVNHARVFVLIEELRRLSLVRVDRGTSTEVPDEGARSEIREPRMPRGPSLVLVGGPLEGMVIALSGAGPWTLGRAKGLEVSLSYDPFVSARNARIARVEGRFVVENIPSSRNGTRVNWAPLKPGERVEIAPGDVIGVGRSLLTFRGA